MSKLDPDLLQRSVSDYTVEELPSYQPVGDVSLYELVERPRAISEDVVRLASPMPVIDARQPTNSERLRLEAIYQRKKANRYLKHLEWKAGKDKGKPKVDGRTVKWKRRRAEERRRANHKVRRHEENSEKYWNLKLLQGEWHSAKLRAELNGVEWGVTELEWEESGIEEVIGDVKNPSLRRYDVSKPWTLDNLMVLDDGGKVIWDGVEEKMRRLEYII
jgi:hypothetical protein